ncbi:3-deoxy-D-manno-octulosonic acid transferase [Leptobacterium sp. I13]|uniref:3-deoxy-D-manno-octulosonic acid transferase n=1 Tax=Leptobacterium meishanense TaxID=3128904 RepID=UPI0030EB64B3
MIFIYNILVYIAGGLLRIVALFNEKLQRFIHGRKGVFEFLEKQLDKEKPVIWFHTASLGEFEQGLPVMEQVKTQFPKHQLLVTFFSPSGYEVKKEHPVAAIITYLPLDTQKNAARFLDIVKPELAIFIKYEFWPNYLLEIHKRNIKTLMVSAIFRKDQAFFKWYGSFMRKSLKAISHFFVQDNPSKALLNSIGIDNVTVSGDTRFDRVSEILDRDNTLDFVDQFKQNKPCMVAGSTWPEDEKLLVSYLNNEMPKDVKCIIAPHTIKPARIQALKASIDRKTILYSEREGKNLADYDVLIIDIIGLLTKVYSYADVAYVGGGMGTSGLHNTLEPAVFGIPVVIGNNYQGFKEAEELVALGGIIPVWDATTFKAAFTPFLKDDVFREKIGNLNAEYIAKHKGASRKVMAYLTQ